MDIYEYKDYRAYLSDFIEKMDVRGAKGQLSRHLGCQPSFLSHVLTGRSDLSLEYALRASEFCRHTRREKDFFMLLVQKEKSGTAELKKYFEKIIEETIEKRDEVKEAVGLNQKLSATDFGIYYSNWWYAAIHIATALPQLSSASDIAHYLNLSLELVDPCLEFLISRGLVTHEKSKLQIGTQRIHIGSDSPLVNSHHKNWRLKSVSDLKRSDKQDIHFTGILGLSKKDGLKIRKKMLELIRSCEPIIRESEDEELFIMLLDFYSLA